MSGRFHLSLASALLAMTTCFAPIRVASAGDLRPGVWTSFQHDLQRSGRVDGKGAIASPKVAWKLPVGGSVRSDAYVTEVFAAPLEGDGRTAVLTIAAGRVRATRADGSEIWKTPIGGWSSILGVWNVDGKGAPEVFVDIASSVQVLDGSTGAVLRSLPSGQLLQGEFVPLDSSGAGVVVFQSSRGSVTAYDFRDGVAASKLLWNGVGYFQTTMAIGDVDGDGKPDIVRSVETGFEILDPLTGAARYTAATLGPRAYYYGFLLANVDGKPGDEIVVFDDSYVYSPTTGVYVLGIQAGALKTLWSSTDAATLPREKDHFSVGGSAADLDGDGKIELVYSRWDGTKWATRVVDALDGTVLASLDGVGVEAVADIDGDGKYEVVARDLSTAERLPTHSTLRAWDFDGRTAGAVAKSWSVPRAHVAGVSSYVKRGLGVWLGIPVVADFDPSTKGSELAVDQLDALATNPPKLLVIRGDGSTAAQTTWDPDTTASLLWFGDKLSSSSSTGDLLAFSSDGRLRALKSDLSLAGSQRTGTYAGYSLVLPVSSERAFIANTTSARELRFYDGSRLQPDGTPVIAWRVRNVNSTVAAAASSLPFDPVTFIETKERPLFVDYEQVDGATVVIARDSGNGAEKWRSVLSSGAGVGAPGAYPADLNGDGTSDLVMLLTSPAGPIVTVFDGQTGKQLKSAALNSLVAGADQLFTGALVDLDGDSIPELVGSVHALGMTALKISAEPMTALWSIPKQFDSWNGIIGAAELDRDAEIDLFRVNGGTSFGHYMRLDAKGVVDAHVDPGTPALADKDRNAAALVRRDAKSFDLVTTGTRDIGASRVRRLAGDTLSTVWTGFASGGKVSDLAPTDLVALGTPVVADVDGDSTDDVVFGGGDGWLYAVHAADGKLLFSMDLGTPVDKVILANVDGDPELEILATLADGNLVAIDGDGKYVAPIETTDAGVETGPDAAADVGLADTGSDAAVPPGDVEGGGGCSCGTTGQAGAELGLLAFGAALAAAGLRRRAR